jgi:hypothetical protein
MIEKYGYRSVYLATDDAATAASAARQYPNVRWLIRQGNFNRTAQGKEKWQVEERIAKGQVDGFEDMMEALVDILLLADCQGLVGKFTSNIDRVAYSLMSAKGAGCLRPFVSLDAPW